MRASVETMPGAVGRTAVVRAVKHAVDPRNIISPGRYPADTAQ